VLDSVFARVVLVQVVLRNDHYCLRVLTQGLLIKYLISHRLRLLQEKAMLSIESVSIAHLAFLERRAS
jgi:hypothetical protein